ncbi:type VI secretion system tip protein VgrG [Colwellia sp. MB02u-10]|uniref:type VI secretion system Vgr family protein n=1 Tax=Colwellia sp. MB02u-10 TaxID=2759828 RepID=UPI0015F480B8|nr:type VI secretion system tip protein TssI/VgrG [Colwellia sp. MB02u-10]MBA6339757.1 type VI secretion system tip protein VgrG [Colwellia sp. MB02u-10]
MTQFIAFTFEHAALTADDKIKVINFTGNEGISIPYEFLIELKSDNADLNIDDILDTQATFTIKLGDDSRVIQGLISQFDAIKQVNNHTIYRAKLVPKLWELSLYHTNEIYLDKTVPEIIEMVLKEAGFTSVDYDISGLQGEYRKWPYKCQYGETHLDFISRLLERDGIYYYFSEGEIGEKIIFCDHLLDQDAIATPNVLYSPVSSMEINNLGNNVHSFISQQKRVPYKVLVKDYNDDSPTVDIKGEAIIDPNANKNSEVYVWGQNIETTEEGQQLATIRAEEIGAGKKTYHGESSVIRLLSGFNFTLQEHFRQTCNQEYLLLTISHEGSDPSALDFSDDNSQQQSVYVNQFSAIASSVQFRSPQLTPRPEIHGTLNAFIDAEGDGEYAELDEEGRYRVTMPFDRVNRDGGKSSHWLRMSQPFAGANAGMSFPMRKGGEVLLTFIGGDPDRPVIAGSIPNAAQPSISNSDNQTNSMIQTASGNKIEIEDKNGKNRIKFQTGDNKAYMHLGAANHPGDGFVVMSNGIERKEIVGGKQITLIARGQIASSDKAALKDADSSHKSGKLVDNKDLIDEQSYFQFPIKSEHGDGKAARQDTFNTLTIDNKLMTLPGDKLMTREIELSGYYLIDRTIGDKYIFEQGNEYRFNSPGDKCFSFGADRDVTLCQDDSTLRDGETSNGAEDSYDKTEATHIKYNQTVNSQLGEYLSHEQTEVDAARLVLSLPDLLTRKMTGYQSFTIGPDGKYKKFDRNLTEIEANDLLDNKSQTSVAKHNTFNIQEGNIFDFGGYWNYNLGNSYVENHGDQSTEVNRIADEDAADEAGPQWQKITGKDVEIEREGTEAVEKTYANSYDYTKCDKTIEISVVGKAESQTYGKTYDYHYGDSYEEIHGNATSVFGKIGGSNYTNDRYYGLKDEMMMGATSSMSLAAASDLFLGAKSDMSLAIANNVFLGAMTDVNISAKAVLEIGPKAEFGAAEVKAKAAAIEAKINAICTRVNTINSALNCIASGVVSIDNYPMLISPAGLKLL